MRLDRQYAAISWDCWRTLSLQGEQVKPFLHSALLVINAFTIFSLSLEYQVFQFCVFLSCPSSHQLVKADGIPFWYCWRLLPVRRKLPPLPQLWQASLDQKILKKSVGFLTVFLNNTKTEYRNKFLCKGKPSLTYGFICLQNFMRIITKKLTFIWPLTKDHCFNLLLLLRWA